MIEKQIAWLRQNRLAVALLSVLCVYAFVLFSQYVPYGFNPYTTNDIDQVWVYNEAYKWLTLGLPVEERTLPGYPPGVLYVQHLAYLQLIGQGVEPTASHGVQVLNLVRQWSIVSNIITVVIIFAIGYTWHSSVVGLVSAFVWVNTPLLMPDRLTAIAEPFQFPLLGLTLWMMLLSMHRRSRRFAFLSVLFGLSVIVMKYNVFPVLGFGVGLATYFMVTDGWRRWLPVLVAQFTAIGLTAVILFIFFEAGGMFGENGQGDVFLRGTRFTTWESFIDLLIIMMRHVGIYAVGFLLIIGIGIGAYIVKSKAVERITLLIIVVVYISQAVLVLRYLVFWDIAGRYVAVFSLVTAVLAGLGFVYFVDVLIAGLKRLHRRIPFASGLVNSVQGMGQEVWQRILVAGLVIVWTIPQAPIIAREFELPNYPRVEQAMMEWARFGLNTGTVIIPDPSGWLWVYFDTGWGGYPPPLPTWIREDFYGRSLEEWREIHVNYLLLYEEKHTELLEEHADLLDNMTLLRVFEAETLENPWKGSTIYIYALTGIEETSGVTFGDVVTLLGVNVTVDDDNVTLQPFWHLEQAVDTEYQVFIHILDDDTGEIVAQLDAPPSSTRYPMRAWQVEDDVIPGQRFEIALPDDLGAGTYRVVMGLYDLDTFTRLTLDATTDAYEVTQFVRD